ncbi:MAG: phosphoketolase [Streptosporangiaceae bacterium]
MTPVAVAGAAAAATSGFPDWGRSGREACDAVPNQAVEALWRALCYLSAAQLYLTGDNLRLDRTLRRADVKAQPRGHWGTCPPVSYVLACLGPLAAHRPPGSELLAVHGAGHAVASVLAHAYLTQNLGLTSGAGWSMQRLKELVGTFPDVERYGSEITPLIPGVRYTGGQLGPALAVAQGMVLDAPQRLVVPLIGDGELETGATAAAWLARRALAGTGDHGAVLPVVLANGLRMGGPSLLAGMVDDEKNRYFSGLGYLPFISDGTPFSEFRRLLSEALAAVRPLGDPGSQPVVVLTMAKGYTGPRKAGSRQIAGTPGVHKTPLADPRHDRAEFGALTRWLASYRPGELLTIEGEPSVLVRQALPSLPAPPAPSPPVPPDGHRCPVADVSAVIRKRAQYSGFRLFSPDEASSNRLRLGDSGSTPPWVAEILNEEIAHCWLQGYTETGRDALLATYEAFAAVNTSLLVQHLKHQRLRLAVGQAGMPSVNYLITSLGWRNTYTHQNPGLAGSMLELEHPGLHIYTPADPARAAAMLDAMLASRDQANLLIYDKHAEHEFPPDPAREEIARGAAIWPWCSQGYGRPDLVLASAGDIPARQLTQAALALQDSHPCAVIRYVHVGDLTVLGPPPDRLSGLHRDAFASLFGYDCPVLLAVPIRPAPVRALLAARGQAHRICVLGWIEPGRPASSETLLSLAGLTVPALTAAATRLLEGQCQ